MFVEALGIASATASAAASGARLYNERATLRTMINRLVHRLTKGTAHVVVMGPGGAGKTTLGNLLAAALDTDTEVPIYVPTFTIEKVKAATRIPALIHIGPGQKDRRDATWNSLFKKIATGTSVRVIFVGCWGFHSPILERDRISSFSKEKNDEQFRHDYFEDSRNHEISVLKEMVPHLKSAPGTIKALTLITKQDLWWHQRYDAQDFYMSGEYAKTLNEVAVAKGAQGFQHQLVSGALVQQNLLTGDGFRLASTAEGYDDLLRIANLKSVTTALNNLLD